MSMTRPVVFRMENQEDEFQAGHQINPPSPGYLWTTVPVNLEKIAPPRIRTHALLADWAV